MKKKIFPVVTTILFAFFSQNASAVSAKKENPPSSSKSESQSNHPLRSSSSDTIPESLKPWISWALYGHEQELCPFLNSDSSRQCDWASPMTLNLEDKKGSFSFHARLYADGWVSLPGDENYWPLDVTFSGSSSAVILHNGVPQAFVPKGEYTVSGRFSWDTMPESLSIPAEVGVVKVTMREKLLEDIQRDEDGRLWMKGERSVLDTTLSEDNVTLEAYRLLVDDIPFQLVTRLTLKASGKTRDMILPSPLPEGFVAMSLASPLPTQIEKDGSLKIQIKPGDWEITLIARHQGPVTSLKAPDIQKDKDLTWPEEEIWSFQPQNHLRLVEVSGTPAVDPSQTTLPAEWKQWPAYRVRAGETIQLEERRRGDSDPAPDQISLRRDLWLDFDGKGMTIRDTISGTLVRSARLDMNPPWRLGHVASQGHDQLITSLGDDDKTGFEVRQGYLNLTAESRMDQRKTTLSATGWNHDFLNVRQILHLPPGWRLFAASGADRVQSTWLNRWTLLEIFFVLILSLSFAKLWGTQWGILAFLTMALVVPEMDGSVWIWISFPIFQGLLKLIPEGRFKSFLRLSRIATFLALVIVTVPFLVGHLRAALHPSLDPISDRGNIHKQQPSAIYRYPGVTSLDAVPEPEMGRVPVNAGEMDYQYQDNNKGAALSNNMINSLKKENSKKLRGKLKSQTNQLSANLENESEARLQTGPGIPEWDWRTVQIDWTGLVQKSETLKLFFIPPWLNMFLAFVRTGLICLLMLCVLDLPQSRWPKRLKRLAPRGNLMILIGLFTSLCVLPGAPAQAAELPSPDWIQALQTRLLKDPECFPNCTAISRMKLDVSPTQLTARLEVHMEAAGAVSLPGQLKEWTPRDVMLDGNPSFAGLLRTEDGRLWIDLPPGVHQVIVSGPLPQKRTVQIPLPTKPYFVSASVNGWTLEGLHENGLVDSNLRLVRSQSSPETASTSANNNPSVDIESLPSFVRVERHLILGLHWEVETRVVRLTPPGTGVVLQIPLLLGESVTTPGMRVADGQVMVNLGPQSSETSWKSTLLEAPSVLLKAPDTTQWTEVWTVETGLVWHLKMEGIPAIHHYEPTEDHRWIPEWHPWPGEEVTLSALKPQGIEGPTATIDRSDLTIIPGTRTTRSVLKFDLRSTLGSQHTITLPKDSELQSVSINDQIQPIRQVGDSVSIPLLPGQQTIQLTWNEPVGIKPVFKISAVDLGLPSVNSLVRFQNPERWILCVKGPRLGPAVLFWSTLIVIFLASLGLARTPLTTIKTYQWFLLGLGLTQIPVELSLIVVGWLLALGYRRRQPFAGPFAFDLIQLCLVGLTIGAMSVLVFSIQKGLLGLPDMQITGNGSSNEDLIWFQDRASSLLPRPVILSLPLYAYRLTMLAWALWLAMALIRWLRWGWDCFSSGGLWKPMLTVRKTEPQNKD